MFRMGDANAQLGYLCEKLIGLQQRLNITDIHMMRLMEIDAVEWSEIIALSKSVGMENDEDFT